MPKPNDFARTAMQISQLGPSALPPAKGRERYQNLLREHQKEAMLERHRRAALENIASHIDQHAIRSPRRDPVEAELVAEAEEYARRRRIARAAHERRVQYLAEAQERRRLGLPPDPRWFAPGEQL